MNQYIKKLRNKPEEVRKQILFFALLVCMSLVFFIWIVNLGKTNQDRKEKELAGEEIQDKSIKPFSILKNSIKDTYEDVYSSVSSMKLPEKEEILDSLVNQEKSEQVEEIKETIITEEQNYE